MSDLQRDLHALAHLVGQPTRIADERYPDRATDAATTRRYFTTWAHELLDDH